MVQIPTHKPEEVIWTPQPGPQQMLLSCPIKDILYGGARGGGKTDGSLGHFGKHAALFGKFAKGIFVRHTYKDLEDVISRGKELFAHVASWKENKAIFEFGNKAVLKMRYLENENDAQNYQGHAYTWICGEEAGNFPDPRPLDILRATLRSAEKVDKYYLMTANPGGPGHNWLKRRYIDPAPPMTPFTTEMKIAGRTIQVRRVFIPAKVSDNKLLLANDPGYIDQIIQACAGQEWLVKAWLDGEWDIVAGGAFDDLWDLRRHIVPPFQLPYHWPVYRSFDWGSSKPFSVGWWTRATGEEIYLPGHGLWQPHRGSPIRIGEYYGCRKEEPNVGIKLAPAEIANNIRDIERARGWNVTSGVADSSIFYAEHGESIAAIMEKRGVTWDPADKKPGSRRAGFITFRTILQEALKPIPEGPALYVTSDCRSFINTVPTLPRDKKILDDVDTDAEDHCYDESRYFVTWEPSTITQMRLGGT